MGKKILILFIVGLILGVGTGLYIWKFVVHKPHKSVEDTKGISITAFALAKEYTADEKKADSLYLNKAIEVSGTINETIKNQDGGLMVVLQTEDTSSGIQCTLLKKEGAPVSPDALAKGAKVVIKGFCSGNGITGVSLTDCVIK